MVANWHLWLTVAENVGMVCVCVGGNFFAQPSWRMEV